MNLVALFVLMVIAFMSMPSSAVNGIDISGATCNSLSSSDFQCLVSSESPKRHCWKKMKTGRTKFVYYHSSLGWRISTYEQSCELCELGTKCRICTHWFVRVRMSKLWRKWCFKCFFDIEELCWYTWSEVWTSVVGHWAVWWMLEWCEFELQLCVWASFSSRGTRIQCWILFFRVRVATNSWQLLQFHELPIVV